MNLAVVTRIRLDDLSPEEVRVLGCLVEVEATAPGKYPVKLGDLVHSCNQSKGRDPVVDYDHDEVEHALGGLVERRLIRVHQGFGRKKHRYSHALPKMLRLDEAETALLGVLLLRGPQTVRDLKSRTAAHHDFETIDEVSAVLRGLASRAEPLVARTDQRSGGDSRWTHLLQAFDSASGNGKGAVIEPAEHSLGVLDPYGEATAEFYDLLATQQWAVFGEHLRAVLAGVDPSAGPLLDLGAGTGVGLAAIRAAVPGVEIHALEPSKAMRTALHARLAIDPELRAAVTVDPRPLADAVLPDQVCGIVANAVLGHLTDAERKALWRYVADNLPPGAPAVIELLPPERPITIPNQRYTAVEVGRYTYEGWQAGVPDDVEHMRWTLTYRVLDGDRQVAEYKVQSRWRCLGADDLRAEIRPFGLELVEGDEYVVIRRPARPEGRPKPPF